MRTLICRSYMGNNSFSGTVPATLSAMVNMLYLCATLAIFISIFYVNIFLPRESGFLQI